MVDNQHELINDIYHRIHRNLFDGKLKGKIQQCTDKPSEIEYDYGYPIPFIDTKYTLLLSYNDYLNEFNFKIQKSMPKNIGYYCSDISDILNSRYELLKLDCEAGYFSTDNFAAIYTEIDIDRSYKRIQDKNITVFVEYINQLYEAIIIYEDELSQHMASSKINLYEINNIFLSKIKDKLSKIPYTGNFLNFNSITNIFFKNTSARYSIPLLNNSGSLNFKLYDKLLDFNMVASKNGRTHKECKGILDNILPEDIYISMKMEGNKFNGTYTLEPEGIEYNEENIADVDPEYLIKMLQPYLKIFSKAFTAISPNSCTKSDLTIDKKSSENLKAEESININTSKNIPSSNDEFDIDNVKDAVNKIYDNIKIFIIQKEIFKSELSDNVINILDSNNNKSIVSKTVVNEIGQILIISYNISNNNLEIAFSSPFDIDEIARCEKYCNKFSKESGFEFEIDENIGLFRFYFNENINPCDLSTHSLSNIYSNLIPLYEVMSTVFRNIPS